MRLPNHGETRLIPRVRVKQPMFPNIRFDTNSLDGLSVLWRVLRDVFRFLK